MAVCLMGLRSVTTEPCLRQEFVRKRSGASLRMVQDSNPCTLFGRPGWVTFGGRHKEHMMRTKLWGMATPTHIHKLYGYVPTPYIHSRFSICLCLLHLHTLCIERKPVLAERERTHTLMCNATVDKSCARTEICYPNWCTSTWLSPNMSSNIHIYLFLYF